MVDDHDDENDGSTSIHAHGVPEEEHGRACTGVQGHAGRGSVWHNLRASFLRTNALARQSLFTYIQITYLHALTLARQSPLTYIQVTYLHAPLSHSSLYLNEANDALHDCRYALKFTYVYAFYLPQADNFRHHFEMQQMELEKQTEDVTILGIR